MTLNETLKKLGYTVGNSNKKNQKPIYDNNGVQVATMLSCQYWDYLREKGLIQ